ncbi:IS21 family transposase [Glutamicibacter sp. AOP12-B1-11]|uniref:IS21 family transposase n=1 Tax=Glutamicibacter sp. AOP12-B1-11 TaxID=3457725 RepID=UPI004033CA99
MADYRKIMLLLLQGRSYRQVQSRLNCSPRTISKARQVIDEQELTTAEQVNDLSDEVLEQCFTDGRKTVSINFMPIDIEAVIRARIGRKKPPLKVLWARYLRTEVVGTQRHYQYERFCQLVAEQVQTRNLTSPIAHEPGHTMQVDWADTKMLLVDPITGRTTKVSVFVATLPYSGLVFAYGYLDEKLGSWCDAHRRAFEYAQGVAQVIIPDNASTPSNAISRYENVREVNQSYSVFLEHYRTAAVPTNPYKPQHKGNVESGVQVVTNWIIRYLNDQRFASLDDLNEAVATRVEWINERTPFRGEPRSRQQWFEQDERHELMDLPQTRWQQIDWRKAKVSRDWHLMVDTIKYSVPSQYAGQSVDVRIIGEQVSVMTQGLTIAEHTHGTRRYSFVTNPEHAPAGYEDTSLLWTRAYFLRQASKVGPSAAEAVTRLLDQKKIEAQGFRSCMNILALGKGMNRSLLERACHDLCGDPRTSISYTAVKHRVTVLRAEAAGRPTVMARPAASPNKDSKGQPAARVRDTGKAYLAGASAFRLAAMTSAPEASATRQGENHE